MAKRSREPLQESDKRKLNKDSINQLRSVFKFMRPYRGMFIFGLVSLGLSSFTIMSFPRLSGELLDAASGKSVFFSSINQVAVALVIVLFIQAIFSFIRVYTFAAVSERGIADIRKALYEKIVWSPVSFFDSRRVGELMSRVTADVGTLYDTFSFTLAEFLRQILTLVIGVILISFMAPMLTAFMLLTFPVLVIAALIFGKYIRKLSKKTQDQLAEANVIVEESLQSISVVKAFTNELYEISRYGNALQETVLVAIKSSRYRAMFVSFVIFVIFGGIVAVGWYGATLVQRGGLTPGMLFSFVLYTSFIGFSIAGLGDIYSQLQRAIGASERVLEILNQKDESVAHGGALKVNGEIEFDHVTFSYPSRTESSILKDLSFKIRAGEKIALIGQSGAGKSTIINLLLRFYNLSSGTIRVDQTDVNNFNLLSYRENIGIVPQEVILFGGTIAENIAYGKPGASAAEIRDAAQKANALEFIDGLKDKFDTVVGERGTRLSGGQRQRIAIARAILKDPAILVLDEATSSLDAHSESLVQEALEKLMENRTTIVIAHRLSTIKKVDRIFVIKDGKLAETGSHKELTQLDNGIYSNLLKLQLQ